MQPTSLEQLAQELVSRDFLDKLEADIVFSARCRFCDRLEQESDATVGWFYSSLIRAGWRNITTSERSGLACPACAAQAGTETGAV